MKNIKKNFNNYLNHCITQKRLDEKTIKAYRIDLLHFALFGGRKCVLERSLCGA